METLTLEQLKNIYKEHTGVFIKEQGDGSKITYSKKLELVSPMGILKTLEPNKKYYYKNGEITKTETLEEKDFESFIRDIDLGNGEYEIYVVTSGIDDDSKLLGRYRLVL